MNLKPCPCGKTPTTLHIDGLGKKWAYASGDCCDGWSVEFRNHYAENMETVEGDGNAEAMWNETARATDSGAQTNTPPSVETNRKGAQD